VRGYHYQIDRLLSPIAHYLAGGIADEYFGHNVDALAYLLLREALKRLLSLSLELLLVRRHVEAG